MKEFFKRFFYVAEPEYYAAMTLKIRGVFPEERPVPLYARKDYDGNIFEMYAIDAHNDKKIYVEPKAALEGIFLIIKTEYL